jgi:hypothetical protein
MKPPEHSSLASPVIPNLFDTRGHLLSPDPGFCTNLESGMILRIPYTRRAAPNRELE